jgi:hypothetical protein
MLQAQQKTLDFQLAMVYTIGTGQAKSSPQDLRGVLL